MFSVRNKNKQSKLLVRLSSNWIFLLEKNLVRRKHLINSRTVSFVSLSNVISEAEDARGSVESAVATTAVDAFDREWAGECPHHTPRAVAHPALSNATPSAHLDMTVAGLGLWAAPGHAYTCIKLPNTCLGLAG